jgi:acetylornithine/succinyldiaminopimelate/putrescine aminotransferase
MRIECKTAFLDGTVRFEDGDIVTVPDADAQRFIDNGWAKPVGGEAGPAAVSEVSLDVHNATHASKVTNHG